MSYLQDKVLKFVASNVDVGSILSQQLTLVEFHHQGLNLTIQLSDNNDIKFALIIFIFVGLISVTSRVNAMDLSGTELREIPIPEYEINNRREELFDNVFSETTNRKVKIDEMSDRNYELLIRDIIRRQSNKQTLPQANPQALCLKKFGPGYKFSGVIGDQRGRKNRKSYLCAKFGPSKRSKVERLHRSLEGLILSNWFKLDRLVGGPQLRRCRDRIITEFIVSPAY